MSDDDRPPGGLPFAKAVREFSDPELLAEYDRACAGSKRARIRVIPFEAVGQVYHDDKAKKLGVKKLLTDVLGDFWRRVETTGDVIAVGHLESLAAPAQEVPRDEWGWLSKTPEKGGVRFQEEGGGRTWHRVLFYRKESVVIWHERRREFQAKLNRGLTLTEWAAWREPEIAAAVGASRVPLALGKAPTAAEKRKSGLYRDAVRRLRERLQTDVEGGRIALGLPSGSPSGDAKPVSDEMLTKILSTVQFSPVRGEKVPLQDDWIEVLAYPPGRFRNQSDKGETTARPKGTPGRKAIWDWEGAMVHLLEIANLPDGLPETQAEIERTVADWFMDNFGDHPAESTIREKVRTWCGEILNKGR
jgi:hypothetical protein